jgi:hypothetical protein
MDQHNEQFENVLREFTPARPGALPAEPQAYSESPAAPREIRPSKAVWPRRLAAAAAIAIAAAGSLWFSLRKPGSWQATVAQPPARHAEIRKPEDRNQAALMRTRFAVADPAHFDEALSEIAPDGLPRFDRPNSALHALAQ